MDRVYLCARIYSHERVVSTGHFYLKRKRTRILSQLVYVRAMASERQKQGGVQPGKEHVMDPTPQFSSSDYQPSNKLRVIILSIFIPMIEKNPCCSHE